MKTCACAIRPTWIASSDGLAAAPFRRCSCRFDTEDWSCKTGSVVSPMDMYSCARRRRDFSSRASGNRALGGAGLLFTEMTCVTREGRISPGCAGMYLPEHMPAWKRIVDFVHASSRAKICLQLGHSGPKARRSCCGRGWTNRSTRGTGRSSRLRRSRMRPKIRRRPN